MPKLVRITFHCGDRIYLSEEQYDGDAESTCKFLNYCYRCPLCSFDGKEEVERGIMCPPVVEFEEITDEELAERFVIIEETNEEEGTE
jgi:hypothetical protein